MILFLFFGQIVLTNLSTTLVLLCLSLGCVEKIYCKFYYIYIYIYIYHLPIDVIMSVMGEFKKKKQLKKFQINILEFFFWGKVFLGLITH